MLALVAVVWLDVTKGGEATPGTPLGEIGTPVRSIRRARPRRRSASRPRRSRGRRSPASRPRGSPSERDFKRQVDLLLLLDAAAKVKARDGSYPSTNGNVQTLCKYKDIDPGCKIQELAVGGDAVADPPKTATGTRRTARRAKFYAILEGDVPEALAMQDERRRAEEARQRHLRHRALKRSVAWRHCIS